MTSPQPRTLKQSLEAVREQIAAVCPPHIKPERVIRMALLAAHKNADILKCSQDSVLFSVIQIASWGLEIGRTAHLVPFGTTCTPLIAVSGIAQAIIQSGEVMSIDARVAREGEHFRVLYGTKPDIEHEPIIGNTGEIVAFYAVFTLPDGSKKFEVMSKAEVDKVRASSRSGANGPWKTWYDEMGKKTVVKRGAKLIPMTERVSDIIDADNAEYETDAGVVPTHQAPTQRGKSRTLAALKAPEPNPLDALEQAGEEVPVGREPGEEG